MQKFNKNFHNGELFSAELYSSEQIENGLG